MTAELGSVLIPLKRNSLLALMILIYMSACSHQNDGSLLVLEGDESKTCSELHTAYELAGQMSKENIPSRRRWLVQLMRDGDCRLPKQADMKFNFHLTISG